MHAPSLPIADQKPGDTPALPERRVTAAALAVRVEGAALCARREILGRDCLEGSGSNAEYGRKGTVTDVVLLHRQQVVATHELARKELQHGSLELREAGAERHDRADGPGHFADIANELKQRVDLGTAQVISRELGQIIVQRLQKTMGDIADMNWLETRVRRDQRDHGKRARQPGEHVEERILTTENHRGPENRPAKFGSGDESLRVALGAKVLRGARRIRTQRAHVQQARYTGSLAGGDDVADKVDVRAGKGIGAAFVEDAHEVDHRRGAGEQRLLHLWIVDIGLDDVDRRKQNQMLGGFAAAGRDDHAMSGRDQARDHMTADEAGAAEHHHLLQRHRLFHVERSRTGQ